MKWKNFLENLSGMNQIVLFLTALCMGMTTPYMIINEYNNLAGKTVLIGIEATAIALFILFILTLMTYIVLRMMGPLFDRRTKIIKMGFDRLSLILIVLSLVIFATVGIPFLRMKPWPIIEVFEHGSTSLLAYSLYQYYYYSKKSFYSKLNDGWSF